LRWAQSLQLWWAQSLQLRTKCESSLMRSSPVITDQVLAAISEGRR
jgi:hypothetical protein